MDQVAKESFRKKYYRQLNGPKMNEDLWNEVMAQLMPNVTMFSGSEDIQLIKQIGCLRDTIDENKNLHKFPFSDQSEIVTILEKLLNRSFDDTVYLYSPELFVSVIKASLRKIIELQYKIFYSDPVWLWNPTEGYMIEDSNVDCRIVVLVPKTKDLFPQFELKKDTFARGLFGYSSLLGLYTRYCGITMFDAFESNKILPSLQKIVSLTSWGHIDWEAIQQKTVVGEDPNQIIPALEKLNGKPFDHTVYVEWCDADLPLISADLGQLLTHYRELRALSIETILFNLTTPYIIEINVSGIITVGILTGNNT